MLSRTEIEGLWMTGGPFREIAAEEMILDFGDHADLFFRLLPEDETGALVRHAKGEFPFLWHGYCPPSDYNLDKGCGTFDRFRRQEKEFRDELERHLATLPPEEASRYRQMAESYFPELVRYLPPGFECNRQLMVFVTGHCNLRCPYCFSNDIEHKEISLSDLKRIFDWAASQGVTKITPCGGEPLIYRHFAEFISMASERGMKMYFASNLTIPLTKYPDLLSQTMEGTYAHLTTETMKSGALMDIFENNVAYCRKNGIEVVGRVNLTEPDAKTLIPAVEKLHEMGLDRINFALTIPSTKASNRFVATEKFDTYISALAELIHVADTLGMQSGIAKPLPVCKFDDNIKMRMMSASVGALRCEIDSDDFMHNISLSPTMEFSPCLGLENVTEAFRDDITWSELHDRFAPLILNLMQKPLYEQCTDCYLWKRRLCQGSCLSYKIEN